MKLNKIIVLLCVGFFSLSASAQSLDSLLKRAYDNNPDLKALQLEYEAALQKGPQVNQLPDPTVGVGVPVLAPQTRLGGQVLSVSASQMFPWFGTLKAKEDVVLTMAKTKYEMIASTKLEIDFQIKNAYYNLYLLQAKQEIIKKNIRIYETIEKVSFAKVESGKSIASDALNVRLKIEEIKNEIATIDEQKKILTAQINQATNSPIEDDVVINPQLLSPALLSYNLASYKEKIQTYHPMIKQLDWKIQASEKELTLNDFMGKPTFGVGLDYSVVSKRTDANPMQNGRDILIPKLMMSIPIYRKKYSAKEQEEKLIQQAIGYQKEGLVNNMLSRLQSYNAEYESAKLTSELAKKQLIITESAFDILLYEYSSKGTRFDELMKLQNDIVKYELATITAIVQTHLAKAKVDRITNF